MSVLTFQDWVGPASDGWKPVASRIALGAFVAAVAFLLARAVLRRHRYRAVGVLSEPDMEALHAGLVAAERRTIGEILVVVLERSDAHPEACWLAALATCGLGSLALAPWLPWNAPLAILGCQLALALSGWASARFLPDVQRAFLSGSRARAAAEEQAFQEFHRYELHHTREGTGVLLFVSLLERRAVVLGDRGIDARVTSEHWHATVEAVLDGIRRESLRAGLLAGIRGAGEVLAEHFPVEGEDRNEVPDRVIVRSK